jgi:hypothetical protein
MAIRGPSWGGRGRGPLAAVLLLLLAACAAPTPYQPAVDGFGYAQQQIEANRYRVTFAGNMVTSRDTVQNYLLYRSAEITLESGHDYFVLTDQNLERSTVYYGTGPTGFGYRSGFDVSQPVVGVGFGSYSAVPVDSYTAFADILVFDGVKPADDTRAYEAREVLRRLDPAVLRAPGVARIEPPAETQQ